ncbi:hypothetical protein DFH06DRAFT_1152608 [Mycena polygramma]|nr:hypothetical protein DFH06DRAFT_1152608 [Mycena polygramma]
MKDSEKPRLEMDVSVLHRTRRQTYVMDVNNRDPAGGMISAKDRHIKTVTYCESGNVPNGCREVEPGTERISELNVGEGKDDGAYLNPGLYATNLGKESAKWPGSCRNTSTHANEIDQSAFEIQVSNVNSDFESTYLRIEHKEVAAAGVGAQRGTGESTGLVACQLPICVGSAGLNGVDTGEGSLLIPRARFNSPWVLSEIRDEREETHARKKRAPKQ